MILGANVFMINSAHKNFHKLVHCFVLKRTFANLQALVEHRNEWISLRFGRFSFGLSFLKVVGDLITSQATRKHLPSGTDNRFF